MARERDDTKTLIERRREPRYDIKVDVNYAHDDSYLYSRSSNISEMGIFLMTSDPLRKGTRLELRFAVPGQSEALAVRGEVRWIVHPDSGKEPGMGVQFVDISDEARSRIRELIRTMAYLE
jgi:type IV pilus assembly protein PilZ